MRLSAFAVVCGLAAVRAGPVVFDITGSPGDDAAVLDPSPVSFGYPFATLEGYFPGIPLAMKCMHTFRGVTGIWPRIRVGGTSQDHGTFDPDLGVPNIVTGTAPTGHAMTTYGPLLMRLIADYEGTIVWGLNRGYNNITNSIEAAKAALRELPTLYALELGNEPDVYGGIGFPIAPDPDAWTPQAEAESESEWQTAVGEAIGREDIFQAASYYRPPTLGWGVENYFKYADPAADKYIKVFSHHNYPQSAIARNEPRPDAKALMSHVNVTANVGLYVEDVKIAATREFDYVFGETNSVSGNGQPGQGATFATGLWVLDYALQAASKGIKRLYFHQGTPSKSYYVWFNETGMLSPFYGGYVAAEAMAHGFNIVSLDEGSTNYAGYSIHSASGQAQKVVLINSDFFDGSGTRTTQQFTLNGLHGQSVAARRLTARNSLSRQDFGEAPTFAGRSVGEDTCQFSGEESIETVQVTGGSASFTLAASEALLITLTTCCS